MDEAVYLIKNFILDWKPEAWSFNQAADYEGKASDLFDIIDDWSGDLHSLAKDQ
jgi:hypothetical protein